jgi:hypothetical protein
MHGESLAPPYVVRDKSGNARGLMLAISFGHHAYGGIKKKHIKHHDILDKSSNARGLGLRA